MTELQLPNRYEPLARLGKGGGGEVWAVRDRYTGERYAFKILAEDASEREMEALVREAVALSGLEGLGVPRVSRFGRLPGTGRAYLVRELVDGAGLDELISLGSELSRVLPALAKAADQLTILHRSGLLHGDVKPANIIVEAGGRATFVDLGLAAPFREGGALAEGLTPRYAAPELLQGRPLTARAEVYALGVTLAEALERAHGSNVDAETARELRGVVKRATASLQQDRYPSADEFASALRRAARLGPSSSVPSSRSGGIDSGARSEEDVALWPVVGIEPISNELRDAAHALGPSGALRLNGLEGSGRSVLLRRLGWSLGVEGRAVVTLDVGLSAEAVASELSAYAVSDGARTPTPRDDSYILLDDADGFSPLAIEQIRAARERGARLIAVGGSWLGAVDREIAIPPLDAHAGRDLVRRSIPALGEALLTRVFELSGGRPGELRRLVRLVASEAVASTADVERLVRGVSAGSIVPEAPLDRALHYLDRGRYNDARTALEALRDDALPSAIARARLALGLGDAPGARAELEAYSEANPHSAELRLYLGRAHFSLGESARAAELLEPLVKEESSIGVEAAMVHALAQGALSSARAEDVERALADTVRRAKEQGYARVEAMAYQALGFVLQRADRLDEALAAYEAGILAAERASDLGALAGLRSNLAGLLKVRGDVQGAIEQFEAALDLGRRSGRKFLERLALLNLANLDLYLGRLARAAGYIEELEAERRELQPELLAQLFGLHADLSVRQSEIDEGVRAYEACASGFAALGRGLDAAEARLWGVYYAARQGHADIAELRRNVALARVELGEGSSAHRSLLALASARVAIAAGDEQTARACVEESLLAARETHQREWVWRALDARAELEEQGGQPLLARRDREEALAVLEEIGARLPRDLREVYWNDARRAQLRGAVQASLGSQSEFSPFTPSPRWGSARGTTTLTSGSRVSQAGVTPLEQRLARILEINAELAGEHDLTRLTARITDHAIEIARAERGFVILFDETGALKVHTSRSLLGDALSEEFSRSVAETVVRTREPFLTLNAQSDARMDGYASVHQMMLQSVACVPILSLNGVAVGALYVETRHRPGPHFERELVTLRAFADQVAIALENARLISENQKRRDELERTNQSLEEAQEKLKELLGDRTEQLKRTRKRLKDARDTLYGHFGYHGLVGTSRAMRRVYALIDRVKDTEVPVLVTGESGTGKEMVAKAIHATSARSKAKMLGVNCGAIPENLLESELFGHVRGAFTGADRERKGLFRECEGGTILLDEIGETPAKMQAGLLRVLQERTVRPVGGSEEVPVDVRVIFATNRDLQGLVQEGKFREDLYYRIHVVEIRIPPLRERTEDIPQLVDHFLGIFALRYKREKKALSREALRSLCDYDWPGNVRELEHVLLNAWVLSEDAELVPEDFSLPGSVRKSAGAPVAPRPALKEPGPTFTGRRTQQKGTTSEHHRNERERILDALRACNWNRVKAAELSGIPRRTFYRRLREYGIQ